MWLCHHPVQWHSIVSFQPIRENPPYSVITSFSSSHFPQSLTWHTSYWSHITLHSDPTHNTLVCGCWCMFLPFTRHLFLYCFPFSLFKVEIRSYFIQLTISLNHNSLVKLIKGHFSHPFNKPFNYISLIRAFITLYCNGYLPTPSCLYQLEEDRECVYFFTTVSLNSHFTSMLIINCSVNVLIWFTLILVIPVG